MAFTKFELLTSPSFEKIRILSILFLTTQRDPRKFPASTAVPVLAVPSSYLKVPIVTPGPAVIRSVCKHSRLILITDIIFVVLNSSMETPSVEFTSTKLFVCLEIFSCFLQLSDRAYASRARCIGLFILL